MAKRKRPGFKIGVIGLGVMGENHVRICAKLPGVKLAGIVDIIPERVNELAAKYNTQPFYHHQDLLPCVEAIILASPTETHFDLALDCLNAGKNLFIEKPLTKSLPEAYRLVQIAKERNLVLAAGLIERFNPTFNSLLRLIRKERLIGLDFKRLSPFPERMAKVSVVFDMMIHDLDLMLRLVPDEIESIKASGEKIRSLEFDRVVATVYFKSGLIARLEANRIFGIKTRKITISGESKIYEADLLAKRVYVRDLKTPIPSVVPCKNDDQLTLELADFVRAVKSQAAPKVSGEDAYSVLKLGEEIEKLCS